MLQARVPFTQKVISNMDMGAGAAFESLVLGGAIVGLLCVLPMFVLLAIVVFSFSRRRKDD